jgi:hypothetical protein
MFVSGKIFKVVNNNNGKALKAQTDNYGVIVNSLTVDFANINPV